MNIKKDNWKEYYQPAFRILLGLVIIIMMAGGSFDSCEHSAQAAGLTSVTVNQSNLAYIEGLHWVAADYWSVQSLAEECTTFSDSLQVGWLTSVTANKFIQYRTTIGFDVSAIPVDAEITAVSIWLNQVRAFSAGYPASWLEGYVSFYKMLNEPNIITTLDWDTSAIQGNLMVTSPYKMGDISTVPYQWVEYPIYEGYLDEVMSWRNSSGYLWFTYSTLRSQLNAAPAWIAGSKNAYIFTTTAVTYPKIVVTYVVDAITRTVSVPVNGTINPTPIGTEICDNITWYSPRCAYSDEQLCLLANGDWGANVTLRMIAEDGTLLASVVDSVRSLGYMSNPCSYVWTINLPGDFEGWVKVYEDTHNVESDWGYVSLSPSDSQKNLTVYAYSTNYPQYDNQFSVYSNYINDLMFIHWKTNIMADEVDEYGLKIHIAGDNVTGLIYSENLTSISNNYYDCSSNNSFLSAWRYMILTPYTNSPGYNYYDDAVKNTGKSYIFGNSGFWQPTIYEIADNSTLTFTHSCNYYLQKTSDGIVTFLNGNQFKTNTNMVATVEIGSYSKVNSKLSSGSIKIVNSEGSVVSTSYFTANIGKNTINLISPESEGDYEARFTMKDESTTPYYEYVHDISFKVSGIGGTGGAGGVGGGGVPTVEGWGDWINGVLDRLGLNNEAGHWLIIFILCVVWAIAFRKHPTMATALIIITIAGGLVLKDSDGQPWINPWFIVLLVIGAGVYIYGMLRKKTNTGGSE